MMIETRIGAPLDAEMLSRYFRSLVDQFFKILPLWESGEHSVCAYVESLQAELAGCRNVIVAIGDDPAFVSLLAILQYLIDHPELDASRVKREVFKGISICNKLKARYASGGEEVHA